MKQQVVVTDDLQRAVDEAQQQLVSLGEEHQSKMVEMTAAKDAEAEQLKARIATLEHDLEAVGHDIMMMAQQSDSSGAHVQKLNQDLEAAQQDAKKLTEELANTKATLEPRCMELETENAKLAEDQKRLSGNVKTLERDAATAAATIAELEQGNIQLETEIGEVAKKYRQAHNDAKALNQLIEQTKKLFISQKIELQRESAAIKDVLVETQVKLQGSEADREMAGKENDYLRNQLKETRADLEDEVLILTP